LNKVISGLETEVKDGKVIELKLEKDIAQLKIDNNSLNKVINERKASEKAASQPAQPSPPKSGKDSTDNAKKDQPPKKK